MLSYRSLTIPLVCAAVTFGACGGGSGTASARGSAEASAREALSGQWRPAYDRLVPQQQALFTRDAYMACWATVTIAVPKDLAIKAVDDYAEKVTIPGTSSQVDSIAVTLEVTAGNDVTRKTIHEVNVDGKWRSGLSQDQIDKTTSGTCS